MSVIIPVRNEEAYLSDAVGAVLVQDYPAPVEVVLAIGPSKDRTAEIANRLARTDPRVVVVDNPSGTIPAALNLALSTARHEVISRMDGHALMRPGYLRTGVAELIETQAADVGGVMAAEGISRFQRAVAWGMTAKIGVGSATWHTGGAPAPADSAYLGIYQRQAIVQAGGWDEGMLRAEDWELNYRIRSQGGLVWCTPALQVTYRPRASIKALASQYWHYGRWRRVIIREHPETASVRYLAPPAAATLCALGLLAGVVGIAAGLTWLAIAGCAIPVIYLAGITAAATLLSRGLPANIRLRLPLVLGIMHMCWGAGFLTSPRGLHRVPEEKPQYVMRHGL